MRDKDPGDGPKKCLGGRFDLLDRVGVGGGAVVVRARDRQLHRLVAVKLLRSRDADLRCRFAHESMVLAGMDHPAIVRVLAHDSDGDEPYTVLELIEGPDLASIWPVRSAAVAAGAGDRDPDRGRPGRRPPPGPGPPGREAGEHHVRRRRRSPAGEIDRLRDRPGLRSLSAPDRGGAAPADWHGQALGTPGYLPLEAGLVDPNPSFDVFGLGATLYQLLTGTLPEEPLQPLREAHPGCDAPDDLELVLAAALALEPEDRTRTAAELGRALAAVLAAHPERGTPSKRIDGRYELIGLVGTGAKADAYLAVHRGAGHDVVLKFLRSKDPDDASGSRARRCCCRPSTIRRCRASTTTRRRPARRTSPWRTRRAAPRRGCARRLACGPPRWPRSG
jgi:serine/threonine protein kinase